MNSNGATTAGRNVRQSVFVGVVPLGFAFLAAVGLCIWLSVAWSEVGGLTERLPIPENLPPIDVEGPGQMKGTFARFDGVPADLPGAWPGFRGPNLDAISPETVPLAKTWPAAGPKVLWSIDLGEGYAGAAVLAGRVYVIDYLQSERADAIRCFSLADGREIWRYSYPVKIVRHHGMSRTVPAVTEKHIVTMGPKCHVTCLDSQTGEFRWMLNLVRDFGATEPNWYAGQCPLIEEDRAIIAVGGKCLMMAVDCQTGQIVWETPNPQNWRMTHSSISPMQFAGKRMYVYCGSEGVVGVSAEDGGVLWQNDQWKIRIANVPTPVVVGEDRIFLCGDYNAGSMMLRLTKQGETITAEPLFRLEAAVFGSPQQTPILYNGRIYGVNANKQLACLDLEGRVLWTSTSAHKFGRGPYMIAGGMIYVMDDNGLLTVAEAMPSGYKQLGQAKVLEGPDAWGPMAVASGRLILRDLNRMICLDISSGQ